MKCVCLFCIVLETLWRWYTICSRTIVIYTTQSMTSLIIIDMWLVFFIKSQNNALKKVALGANFFRINKKSVHAEIDAVRKLRTHEKKKKMKPLVLVSFKFARSGELRNAKPCRHCVTALKIRLKMKNYYVSDVIYSNDNGELITCGLDDLLENDGYITRGNQDLSLL
jgi:cytidine deaminase